jgi:hypothetical protein
MPHGTAHTPLLVGSWKYAKTTMTAMRDVEVPVEMAEVISLRMRLPPSIGSVRQTDKQTQKRGRYTHTFLRAGHPF